MRTGRDDGDVTPKVQCGVVIEDVANGDDGNEPGGPRVIRGRIKRIRRKHALAFVEEAPPPPEPVHRPARVARMLALAHRLQEAIERGEYQDRAELARVLGVTKARVSQILDLTLLAPEIQDEILLYEKGDGHERFLTDRVLLGIAGKSNWSDQRPRWSHIGRG
jgi:hypothetical protein